MPGKQSRVWVFTLNNPTAEEEGSVRALAEDGGVVRYMCFGREVGEEGTPHLQGYLELQRRKTLAGVCKVIPRAHFEPRKGTQEQAIEYCKKDGNTFELGVPCRPGRRSDLAAVQQRINEGATMEDIAEEHFGIFLQYRRGLEAYQALRQQPRSAPTHVEVLHGPTGTGT